MKHNNLISAILLYNLFNDDSNESLKTVSTKPPTQIIKKIDHTKNIRDKSQYPSMSIITNKYLLGSGVLGLGFWQRKRIKKLYNNSMNKSFDQELKNQGLNTLLDEVENVIRERKNKIRESIRQRQRDNEKFFQHDEDVIKDVGDDFVDIMNEPASKNTLINRFLNI